MMYKKIIIRVVFILLILIIIFNFRTEIQQLDIPGYIDSIETGYWTVLIILGFFVLKSVFFFIPVFIICFSAGMVLPLYWAVPLGYIGYALEISLGYVYGYFLGNNAVNRLTNRYPRLQEIVEKKYKNELRVTFFSRLTPLAIEPVSLLMGAGGGSYKNYIGASLLGMAPRILIYTLIGSTVVNPFTTNLMVAVILLLLVWVVAVYCLNKKL